jgi:hypothetical protein
MMPIAIMGTPTTAGTYTVNVILTSGTQTVSKQFSLVIASAITGCQYKWWFDSSHPTCLQKQFCGKYMYQGLQTFTTQAQCNAALTQPSITPNTNMSCQNLWWFDSTHLSCSQKQFCGAYMYLSLNTFPTQSDCQSALSNLSAAVPSSQYSASILENIKVTLDQIQKTIDNWGR